jgi:hypothetical protein
MKRMLMIALTVAVLPLGCATTTERVLDTGGETQLQKRSYESRIFDTSDKEMVLRAIISTLQDLGFVTDRADFTLGTVSGTKYERYQIKITVSVRPKGRDRMMVRANAQFNIEPINDPKQYQDFFSSLEKSLFLAAHEAD